MKGFPNQVSKLTTLARALDVLINLEAEGNNPKDDGVFGEALIRREVLGTGHKPIPIEEYLKQQKAKKPSYQSFRTSARGLRELFSVLGLIDDTRSKVTISSYGRQIAALADKSLTPESIRVWRTVILNMTHDGGDGEISHPYQVLLRLVAKRLGITRAKCALALEARNDSDDEIERITALADLDEPSILSKIGVTKATWDNAKKILPRFAEQLGDVRKIAHQLFLSDAPGVPNESLAGLEVDKQAKGPRRPKSSSAVTADSIAKSGTADDWDESEDLGEADFDPAARRAKIRDRLKRHNLLVQKVAGMLEAEGGKLFENPFDCLACFLEEGLLLEVKSLDGTKKDEVARVRGALAQLLYYESFVTRPLVKKRAVRKVACFEHKISQEHIEWLQASDIQVVWSTESGFDGTDRAKEELEGHLGF